MNVRIVEGDLLDQEVQVIVNAWNRNFIPWWLLIPHGVSGAIKKRAGVKPFIELSKKGILKTGDAVWTSAGKLPFQGIIHVAGINQFWVSTEYSISRSIYNAIQLAQEKSLNSIAIPLIGAGVGGKKKERVIDLIKNQIFQSDYLGEVVIVKYHNE